LEGVLYDWGIIVKITPPVKQKTKPSVSGDTIIGVMSAQKVTFFILFWSGETDFDFE
jgi:hypothetical protein